jgi:uncharacterized RmlC-like cupin family protein
MSGKNVGARHLSMNVAVIPPGGIAGAHIHVGFEVMLYILEGRVRHAFGDDLAHRVEHQAGDFIFIEPGVPHEVYNLSDTEPVVAVVARSSADEWDHIVDTIHRRPREPLMRTVLWSVSVDSRARCFGIVSGAVRQWSRRELPRAPSR